MRLRSLSSLAILILISSCNIPTPPPNPPEPPPECLPNLPWCHETNPPMHCGDCKTNPSTDPNYCEKAPDCPPEDPCANITCVPGYHCEDGNCVQDPVIPPNPPANNCPKALAPDSVVYMAENYYGQGIDSTVRVRGDSEFCFLIHGVHTDDCHLEGWPKRAECEMELIFGCPVWEFSVDNGATVHFCNDNHDALASCDHFGNTIYRIRRDILLGQLEVHIGYKDELSSLPLCQAPITR